MTPDDQRPEVVLSAEDALKKMADQRPETPQVTITGQFHYQQPGEQPESMAFAFDQVCEGKGDPYRRKLTITGTTTLDFGWVENPGWISIKNLDEAKTLNFGAFDIPPKGCFVGKLSLAAKDLPLIVSGDGIRIEFFACER